MIQEEDLSQVTKRYAHNIISKIYMPTRMKAITDRRIKIALVDGRISKSHFGHKRKGRKSKFGGYM